MFLFTGFTLGASTADLVPPFHANKYRKINVWELGGMALPQEERIMLVPPVQFCKGCIWTNLEIPKGRWSIQFSIQATEGDGINAGFGFWFTDQYGAEGTVHGGPNIFKGIGLIGTITQNQDRSHFFNLNLIQNNGATNYGNYNTLTPDATIKFHRAQVQTFEIEFDRGEVIVYHGAGSELVEILRKKLTVNIDKNYIGITAQSDRYTTRLDLYQIVINLPSEFNEKADRDVSFGFQNPTGHYIPAEQSLYRSPEFNTTMQETFKYQLSTDKVPEGNAETIFSIIEELNKVAYKTASFIDLNEFIRTSIQPYSDKWHRRTLKLVDKVREARNVMGTAFNYTERLMNEFNTSVSQSISQTKVTANDLKKVIMREGEAGMNVEETVPVKTTGMTFYLQIAALIEFIIFAIGFIVVQIPAVKRRMTGSY